MTHRVLIIEDNAEIANLVQLHFRDINCESDIADNGSKGLEMFKEHGYDLVILDLMLPVLDGLEVCKQMRSLSGYVPIIMLTSKSSELDRVLGLEMGADDYLVKPFSIAELLARAKAQFRRPTVPAVEQQKIAQKKIKHKQLLIEPDKRRVLLSAKEVMLTAKEFDLLLHFANNPGHVYTRMQLLDRVWGYSYEGYEHTVNSHINRLRAKIEVDPVHPQYILTVWGVGYKFMSLET